jgi:undecaprenyl-diphosphatase
MLEALLAWDERFFGRLNGDWPSPTLDLVMAVVSEGRNYIIFFVLAALILLAVGRLQGLRFLVLAVVSVVVADAIGNYVFKYAFFRPRPCCIALEGRNCIAREGVRLLVGCTNSSSFPSNHAINATALATLITLYMPRLWLMAVALAMLVGYSRIYVGVHYPLDVLGGGVLGLAMALMLSAVVNRMWPCREGPDGRRRLFSLQLPDS